MKTLHLYTCQMAQLKNYPMGPTEFLPMNITAATMSLLAPTWKMVREYKNGKITAEEYTIQYHSLMRKSYAENKSDWEEMIRDAADRKGLVFACFCKKGDFCHRHLISTYVSAVAKKMGLLVQIHPEV